MEKRKRRWGDRRDGTLLRNLDSLHFITGIIYPNRCDNEAYISETIDLTNINAYLKKKNETADFHYTLFQVIVAAIAKTITLRPKMNRFVANRNFYQRNGVSLSFVVKKQFSDHGAEALAVLHVKDGDTIEAVHDYIEEQVTFCRSEKVDSSTGAMDMLNSLPRFISKSAVRLLCWLDLLRGLEPGVHRPQERLPPPDQLGHLFDFLHHRGEEARPLLSGRRHRGDAGDRGAGAYHRRAPGRRVLLLQVRPPAEKTAGVPGAAGAPHDGRG